MADLKDLRRIKRGVKEWNEWRKVNRNIVPDLNNAEFVDNYLGGVDLHSSKLSGADFSNANLSGADLRSAILHAANMNQAYMWSTNLSNAILHGVTMNDADLTEAVLVDANLSSAFLRGTDLTDANFQRTILRYADLTGANLSNTNLHGANLEGAILTDCILRDTDLSGANLNGANLSHANLSGANLSRADLTGADLSGANITGVNLSRSMLVDTNLSKAIITRCGIYGISAWNLKLKDSIQQDLVISKEDEPVITVDDLLVAQFIYLILNNENIRNVLNSITSKGVLILGRFADPRSKEVLDGLRNKLRQFDLLPIVFDFDSPTDKDYTETVQTLAGMSMFVIADLTSPKSTPLELEATVKQFKIPYVPIIDISVDRRPFEMLVDLQKSFHWVLPTLHYETKEDLLDDENLKDYIIDPVNRKRDELRKAKNDEPEPILIRKRT